MTTKSASSGQNGTSNSKANKLLAGVQQNLFKILDSLQTQEVNEAAKENTALNDFIKAEGIMNSISTEFGGPSPFFKIPNWNTYSKKFKPIIKRVLQEKTAKEQENKIVLEELEQTIKDQLETVYNQSKIPSSTSTGKSMFEPFVDWVQDTVIQLGTQISQASQQSLLESLMFDKKNGIVPNTSNLGVSSKTVFWKHFIDPNSVTKTNPNGTGIWPNHFQPIVKAFLKQGAGPDVISHEVDEILNRLHVNLSQYDMKNEESIRSWIISTITALPKGVGATNLQKEEMIAELEQVITNLFPQPDNTFFYNNIQELLYQNIINPDPYGTNQTANTQNEMNDDAEDNGGDADNKNKKKKPIKPVVLIGPGVEGIINGLVTTKKLSAKNASILLKEIDTSIKDSITSTFDKISEQGTQGSLINSTYDYQTIARISDYANSLLIELTNDLNKEIPTNSKDSLDAAKLITAAAVSFRQYSKSLTGLEESFKNETQHTAAGSNYKQIKNKVLNYPNTKLQTLDELAAVIYTGNGTPNPLIKQAEFQGVKIAAESAGLTTSLEKILITEEKEAESALTKMKSNAESAFNDMVAKYQAGAKSYFKEIDKFISKKQNFQYDELRHSAIIDAKDVLAQIIGNAIDSAETDAVA